MKKSFSEMKEEILFQKFFNNTKSVLLIPKGDDGKLAASSLALIFEKEAYTDFEKYELKKAFCNFLKIPIPF